MNGDSLHLPAIYESKTASTASPSPVAAQDAASSTFTFESNEDDRNKINDKDNRNNLETPSFIRLFVIRRIVDRYLTSINIDYVYAINDLITVFIHDVQMQLIVQNILVQLITYGIKIYMKQWYNEKQESHIIEMIFNQIILPKFGPAYNQLITYHDNSNNNNNYYQCLLFNSNDLMCQIFQYLDYGKKFDGDLFSCSLVNSIWLYHVWNINSLYHIDLTKLIEATGIMFYQDIVISTNTTTVLSQEIKIVINNVINRLSQEEKKKSSHIRKKAMVWVVKVKKTEDGRIKLEFGVCDDVDIHCQGYKPTLQLGLDLDDCNNAYVNCNDYDKSSYQQENNLARIWQRLIHVKSIHINLGQHECVQQKLLSKLCYMKSIERAKICMCNIDKVSVSVIRSMLSNCQEKIKNCDVRIVNTELVQHLKYDNKLSPLRLINARCICIGDLYFYRIWSNKCTHLKLDSISQNISKKWCEFVMKYCDFSGIENLMMHRIAFDDKTVNKSLLKQMALKFTNLKQLQITFDNKSRARTKLVLFWQMLQAIILRNKVDVELYALRMNDSEHAVLHKTLEQYHFTNEMNVEGEYIWINGGETR